MKIKKIQKILQILIFFCFVNFQLLVKIFSKINYLKMKAERKVKIISEKGY